MRIEAIEIYHVAMPLISPWRTAYGEDAAIESVLVRLQSRDGEGWGESAPFAAPCYSPEWAGGIFAVIRDWLAPTLLGQHVTSGQALQDKLAHFKGNYFAKAALDTAWWVMEANRVGKPLFQLLGATRDRVDVGADFGVADSLDQLIASMGQAVDARFKRIKLKYRPGWDIPMLRAVRQAFPNHPIHIDCNSGYTMEQFDMFCRLDDFRLEMIEQPLSHDDLVDHAKLQREIRTPVCLDESVTSLARASQAIELQSCRYVNIKPGRVGGLTPAIAIHDLCREAGIKCWVGGMLESGIGARICVALAMLDNFTYPADIFPSSRFYERDLATRDVVLTPGEDGCPQVAAEDGPGIGCIPDPEMLKRCTRQHACLKT